MAARALYVPSAWNLFKVVGWPLMSCEVPIRKGHPCFLPEHAFDINVRKHLAPAEELSKSFDYGVCLRGYQTTLSNFVFLVGIVVPHSVKYVYKVRILPYVQFVR